MDDLIPLSEEKSPLTTGRVVFISALVALVIGCLPALTTALIVGDNIKSQQDALIVSRIKTTRIFCEKQNAAIKQTRTETKYLQSILVNSAKQSKPFEATYKRLGLPAYKVRLAQAEKLAAGLAKTSPHYLDCASLVKKAQLSK